MANKPVIGIVGGVGAGKSTVAAEFGKLGCTVISADELNHQILRRPEVVEQVRQWWGPGVLDSQGQIDRQKVGKIVFDDQKSLDQLTGLVHPLIGRRQEELMAGAQEDPDVVAIVLDVPLLIETGQREMCDFLVFVETSEAVRRARLRNKGDWGPDRAKKVEKLQLALDIKARMSDYRVQNNSGAPDVAPQVASLLSMIVGPEA